MYLWAAVITDPLRMVVMGKEEEVSMQEEVVAEAEEVVEATELLLAVIYDHIKTNSLVQYNC